jgi:hypothetical protein
MQVLIMLIIVRKGCRYIHCTQHCSTVSRFGILEASRSSPSQTPTTHCLACVVMPESAAGVGRLALRGALAPASRAPRPTHSHHAGPHEPRQARVRARAVPRRRNGGVHSGRHGAHSDDTHKEVPRVWPSTRHSRRRRNMRCFGNHRESLAITWSVTWTGGCPSRRLAGRVTVRGCAPDPPKERLTRRCRW